MAIDLAGGAGGAKAGMEIGSIFGPAGAGVGGVLGGVLGLFGGGSDAGQAQRMVDPYAPYRASAAQQLHQLMQDPSTVTSLPGYEFLQARGQQGVERAMSARGQTVSTNEMNALKMQDQELAYKMYNDQFNKLSTLSGAGQSPAGGGAAYLNQENAMQSSQMQGLGGLATIFKQFNSTATGGSDVNNSVDQIVGFNPVANANNASF